MLEVGSKVKIVSTFYDVTFLGVTQIVNGREGEVVGLIQEGGETLFEVNLLVSESMGPETLGFYASELEVIEEEESE